jgi:hypothetical protein
MSKKHSRNKAPPPVIAEKGPASAPARTTPRWYKKLALAVFMPVLLLGLVEAGLRIASFSHEPRVKTLWKPTVSGFRGTFEFYLPTEFSPPGYIWLSQPNSPYTDRYGFRLPEIPFEKPADKIRVAFIGGSTTHGGYRPYPERAIRLINDALGTNRYEMLNVACSSYSTHQSLKALERWALPRKPDIVFVYNGWNDMWVAGDGFSDKDKDALLSITGESRLRMPAVLRKLRLTGLLGKVAESVGERWPRQRVSFEDFDANLESMARLCAEAGVKMIAMIRPEQREENFVHHLMEEPTATYAREAFGTTNAYALYKAQSDRIIAIQRSFADRHAHVTACDGWQVGMNMLDRNAAGEFGENVPIFQSDNCHFLEFPDELLAQQVALTIAPEHAEAISNHINSLAYDLAMAEELIREDAPRESIWFLDRAEKRNPDPETAGRIATLRAQAEANFELVDLFRTGRWGGDDPVFESKIAKLKRCLQIRPTDYGIMIQIYRVCIYMNRMEEAAAALSGFQPQNQQQQYEWMNFSMESHVQGKRWRQARRMAEQLIKMNPSHPLASQVLQQIPENI